MSRRGPGERRLAAADEARARSGGEPAEAGGAGDSDIRAASPERGYSRIFRGDGRGCAPIEANPTHQSVQTGDAGRTSAAHCGSGRAPSAG
ncbi:hypothetical protein WS83_20055 [Burkholderia sp. MSMB2042]|uniref:Uncharacterized protein n=1 Tax=Burkholderia savannae TaxID=1637837 RepID=A0ABR5TEV7_9BURK|nr:hypothetical protein WS78_12000 [Burkholderia savannae]KVG37515.1 hypothetical protein WS77_02230 [Burkholderia sp. MSMB0265]KVG88221.1 hypothetical protein WS81_24995 [Burkholderia sp. MSMB2040]KVG93771.1 hypothetical protein WS82_08490 [Burkholderia sp. MSMB2041]KVH01025.1 hypothetical protein WS83_20055 [Burkholderia sp. MSMB2042]